MKLLTTRRFALIFSLIAMGVAAIARLQLLPIPLERDEGAFAGIGHALWQGGRLYTTLFDNKPPLLYAVYGGFTHTLGYSATGVHAGLLIFQAAACFFLYLFVKQHFNKETALLSSAFFSIFAVLPNVFGFAAHATQLLLLPALAGLWLMSFRPQRPATFFFAGLLLGAALLIKQQAVGIVAGAFAILALGRKTAEASGIKTLILNGLLFLAGLIAPAGATIMWFYSQHRLGDFRRWVVEIPGQLLTLGDANINVVRTYILPYFHGFEPALCLALLGALVQARKADSRQRVFPFVLLFATTLAATYLGAAFYPHYFVLALPFLAVLCASAVLALSDERRFSGRFIAPFVMLLTAGYPLALQGDYFFRPDFRKIHRYAYGLNPFPEMEEIGKYLGRMSEPGDILVLGSEPEALVAAGHIPPTGYPFVLDARMPGSEAFQKTTSDYLKNKKPRFVVFVPAASSWFPGYQQSPFVLDLQMFLQQNYVLTGAAQIDRNSSKLLWNDEARKPPADPTKIGALIFRRKE